ncbi:MAG: NTP transferase domain-containing protein [Bacteroidetes bacterium]|nr:NTP transferase domain-containing protein [Bacteroidota bacterium]
MKPTLLILAAGMGSRYGGLKQIDPLGPSGETIIEYSIYDAIHAGFGKVVFVIRESFADDFKERFSGKFDDQIEIAYAFQSVNTPVEGIDNIPEREKPWGTMHAVIVAEHVVSEPFAVINADDFYGRDAFEQIAKFLTTECSEDTYGMVGYVLSNTLSPNGSVSRGVCKADDKGDLATINERTKIHWEGDKIVYLENDAYHEVDTDSIVSMNFWGFHQSVFQTGREMFREFVKENKENPKAEFFIPLVADNLIKSGDARFDIMTSQDHWFGVTYPEDRQTVVDAFKKMTDEGRYPVSLWA